MIHTDAPHRCGKEMATVHVDVLEHKKDIRKTKKDASLDTNKHNMSLVYTNKHIKCAVCVGTPSPCACVEGIDRQ